MLGPRFGERVAAVHDALQAGDDLVAELDYAPLDVRYANLVVRPPFARYAVADAASEMPPGVTRISPADVLIGIEDGAFVAYSRSLRKRLRLEERFLLDAAYFAPPHARFLSLVAQQNRATPRQWGWGAGSASLPFLPRVRYGRIVLSAARWLIPKADLAGDAAVAARTLADWRADWSLPRWVYWTERDVKLLLDLDAPAALELLRGQLARLYSDEVVLEEMLPAFDELWLERDGEAYQHEFVATLTAPARSAPAQPHDFAALDFEQVPRSLQSPWAYVKLYGAANEMDGLVRDVVAALTGALEGAGAIDRWFFLRYRDPDPHVRLRLRAAHGNGASLVEPLSAALEPLLAGRALRRYAFDVYLPDAERYGGPAALGPVEALFHAGSARALAGLGQAGLDSAARNRTALESLAPFAAAWFARFGAAGWLDAHAAEVRTTSGIDYALVRELRARLAAAAAEPADPGERSAVDELAALHEAGALARTPAAILNGLIHMHFNRLGVLYEDEPLLVAHLWRALFRGREPAATPAAGG